MKIVKFASMTLKPGKEQKKWKQKPRDAAKPRKRKNDPEEPVITLSDASGRTPDDLFPDWRKMGANLRQVHFAAEYLTNGFNATKAFKACSANVFKSENLPDSFAACHGSDMLRVPVVQQLISGYTSAWLRGKAFELEHNLLTTLKALAFYDVSMFFNPDGTPKFRSWDEIPVELRRCIEGMEIKFYGRDANRSVLNITLAKRSEALKAISTYVSLMRTGPLAEHNNSTKMAADTELLLSALFANGRKVDRRTPAQLRAEKVKETEKQEERTRPGDNTLQFQGLG